MKFIFIISLLQLCEICADQQLILSNAKIQSPHLQQNGLETELSLGDQNFKLSGNHNTQHLPKSVKLKPSYFDASLSQKKLEYKNLIKQVSSAVVSVIREKSLGSGFIIHPSGLVITNSHVIANSYKEKIILKIFKTEDGILSTEIFKKVKILAKNDRYDLALLKIEDFEDRVYPFVRLARSYEIEQGDEVVAIGSPHGLERSVTKGYVSVSKRTSNREGGLFQAIYIQHTAEINPGNSGGPLFNMKGEVIGVNSLGTTHGDGIGFSVTSDCLRFFLDHLDTYKMSPRNMTFDYQYLPVPGGY